MTSSEPPDYGQPNDHVPAVPRPISQDPTPAGFEPERPSDRIAAEAAAAAAAEEPENSSNQTVIIAGVVTALLVLAGLAWFIFSNRQEPVAAPTTTEPRPPLTTQGPVTTDNPGTAPVNLGYEPRLEPGRCEFDLITEIEHRCGWLVVPEDRQNPTNRREVRIHYVRFESPNESAPDDPIVYLDGGPGGSTLEPLQFSFTQVWSQLLDNRDLIMFDQRGVGYSEPSLDCPEERQWAFSVLDQDLTAEEERAAELEVIGQCRQRLVDQGIDLSQYNSVENAADVRDLRIAMGLEEVNLLGISYGTRLAATVMRDHPEGIRSVVLDSTYTPDVNLTTEGAANFDRALSELWQGCVEDTDCAQRYPDLEERFFALVDRFEESPTEAAVRDFLNGGSWDVLFDGDWLLGTLFQGLYSEQVIPLLPQLVEELESGDTSTLTLLTSNTLANAEFLSLGMMLSVQCNEEVSFTTQEAIDAGLAGYDRIADVFDGASNLGDFMLEVCELWDAGAAAPVANQPVESALPTLILAGEYDPITPPAWGASASAYLSNSTYVEFPGLGHGTSISGGCPLSITFAFLDSPESPPDTSCVADMPGVDFKIPGEPAPTIELVEFTENVLGATVSGVVPESWESVGFGAYARGESAVDQTAILQQAAAFVSPDAIIGLLAGQFNLAQQPTAAGTVESPFGTWQLFRGETEGFEIDIAAVEIGSSSGVIVLISNPDERDQLYEELMLPAIEAFRAEF